MGQSSLPHSLFLRFPDNEFNRIIALPAYLGDGPTGCRGKMDSFLPRQYKERPGQGIGRFDSERARTGRPEAILEGSIISAKRTAASAALAARALHGGEKVTRVAILGCGIINLEITRFLLTVFPEIKALTVLDLEPAREIIRATSAAICLKGSGCWTLQETRVCCWRVRRLSLLRRQP